MDGMRLVVRAGANFDEDDIAPSLSYGPQVKIAFWKTLFTLVPLYELIQM